MTAHREQILDIELENCGVAVLQLASSINKALAKLDVMYNEAEDSLQRSDILSVKLVLREALEGIST